MLRKHKEPQTDSDSVDVNDFIVGNNMNMEQNTIRYYDHDSQTPDLVGDVNDTIIEADFEAHEPPKKRLKASQVLILGATGLFAVGGVASLFLPAKSEQPPVTVTAVQESVAPKAQVSMPDTLAFSTGAEQSLAPVASPDTTTPPASPALVEVAPQGPQPAKVAEPPPASEQPDAPANPVSAQAAEAQTIVAAQTSVAEAAPKAASSEETKQPLGQSAPAADSTAVPTVKPAAVAPTPGAAQPSSTQKPTTPQTTPPAAAAIKKEVDAAPAATTHVAPQAKPAAVASVVKKPAVASPKKTQATPPKPAAEKKPVSKASAQPVENSEESIKKLVSITPEAFGLQSIQEGSLTLEAARGHAVQRLGVGDRLPSGEQILRIDARLMTLVTDRSVIRFN